MSADPDVPERNTHRIVLLAATRDGAWLFHGPRHGTRVAGASP